jgi:6-pyruvoyltetrahydropterin/6-carboxytetrahydropterin synthase
MKTDYSVRVIKDSLVFSAAHFITYLGNQCERLHGHNYRVEVEIPGPLDENHYVFDFIALRDAAHQLCVELDHHVLLPTKSTQINVTEEGSEVVARFDNRRWVFPRADCILLPIPNTTAELLARWIGEQLFDRWSQAQQQLPTQMIVRVEENFGQWAEVRLTREPEITVEMSRLFV